MTLAQGTDLMLLDEPTTYLDLAHQVEVLDLLVDLNQREGRTIVLVLHDLNQACRYAHHLIAMRGGAIVAEGAPDDIVTAELVTDVFGLPCRVITDPVSHTPMVVPIGRHLHVATGTGAHVSDDPIAESAPLLVAHINDEHADWALVVGRGFGDLPNAERAVVVDLDRHGVGLEVTVGRCRVTSVRVPFPEDSGQPAAAADVRRRARRRRHDSGQGTRRSRRSSSRPPSWRRSARSSRASCAPSR